MRLRGVRAAATATIRSTPASLRARAATVIVAPVVMTSSTSTTRSRHASGDARSHRQRRAGESLGGRSTGLRWAVRPHEQRTAWTAQLSREALRQELCLIEPAFMAPSGGRRHPCDDVDGARIHEHRHLQHEPSQRRAGIAILEASDQVAAEASVLEHRVDRCRHRPAAEGSTRCRASTRTDRTARGRADDTTDTYAAATCRRSTQGV